MSAADPKTYLWRKIEVLMGGKPRTIDQVVERTGVSRGSIQRLRTAKTSTGVDILLQVADAFGIEVADLMVPPADQAGLPASKVKALPLRAPDLRASLETLALAAGESPPEVRSEAANLVAMVVKNPAENAEDQIPIIVRKLLGEQGSAAQKPNTGTHG